MSQLHPRAVWLFFFSYLVKFLGFLILILFYISFSVDRIADALFYAMILLAIPVYILFSYIWARLSYKFYRYEITNDAFKKELGVIYKKYVSIPYDRIQNVDVYRGIWARILGLSDLHIQTAGMSSVGRYGQYGTFSEGRLPGLSKEEAEKLRNELIKRVRGKSRSRGL